MKKITLLLLSLLGSWYCYAQDEVNLGLLPQVNLSGSFTDNWQGNFSVESRQILFQNAESDDLMADYRYERTDLTAVISRKTGVLSSAGAGYMLRFEDGEKVHRFLQQYALVQRLENSRLGHRFRFDQTYSSGEKPEFRLRYRLSWENALRGNAIDPNEFYLKLSNEILIKQQASDTELENRIVAALGYYISDRNKLETGLDYRNSGLFANSQEYHLWWTLGWYYTLN